MDQKPTSSRPFHYGPDLERGNDSNDSFKPTRPPPPSRPHSWTRHQATSSQDSTTPLAPSRNFSRVSLALSTDSNASIEPSNWPRNPAHWSSTDTPPVELPANMTTGGAPISPIARSPVSVRDFGSTRNSQTSFRYPALTPHTSVTNHRQSQRPNTAPARPPTPSNEPNDPLLSAPQPRRQSLASKHRRSIDLVHAASQTSHRTSIDNACRPHGSSEKTLFAEPPPVASVFAQQVYAAGREDLVYSLSGGGQDGGEDVVDLTTLARMHQYVLQAKLVRLVKRVKEGGAWVDEERDVGRTLRAYCDSVRDLDYMTTHHHHPSSTDPFLLSTKNALHAHLLTTAALTPPTPTFAPIGTPLTRLTSLRRNPSQTTTPTRWLITLLMAFTGGLSLLVPFLIMILIPGLLPRIVTTSGFMAIFALACAAGGGEGLRPARVAVVCGGYVGVLILFVGVGPEAYFGR